MRSKKKEKKIYIYKLIVTIIFALAIVFVLNTAQNYIRNEITGKTNLVINNGNVTKSIKNDVIVEDDVIYLSTKDIANFFDDHIFYDNKYNQIITTSDTKVATFVIDKNKCTINSSDVSLIAPAKKIGNEFYLPFSEISKSVYNVETKYISETNTVVLVSLDRELVYANSSKNNSVKYMPTSFSKTVDKIEKGKHDELFERFYRADSSRNSETGGHGIGLSVVKAIANAHKGKAACYSNDENSITFKITL